MRTVQGGDLVLLKGRTTDLAARLFFARLGPVRCWKPDCGKTTLCDVCWELGVSPADQALAEPVPPP